MKTKIVNGKPFGQITKGPQTFTEAEQRKHCLILADYLEAKPDSAHDQRSWAEPNKDAPCGTRACAMGWAALSGLFPGLQYGIVKYNRRLHDFVWYSSFVRGSTFGCIVNGKYETWDSAAEMYFGQEVHWEVFSNSSRSKERTIAALRAYGKGKVKDESMLEAAIDRELGYA